MWSAICSQYRQTPSAAVFAPQLWVHNKPVQHWAHSRCESPTCLFRKIRLQSTDSSAPILINPIRVRAGAKSTRQPDMRTSSKAQHPWKVWYLYNKKKHKFELHKGLNIKIITLSQCSKKSTRVGSSTDTIKLALPYILHALSAGMYFLLNLAGRGAVAKPPVGLWLFVVVTGNLQNARSPCVSIWNSNGMQLFDLSFSWTAAFGLRPKVLTLTAKKESHVMSIFVAKNFWSLTYEFRHQSERIGFICSTLITSS